ncbi:MAG: FmdE family protein [Dehalococcoidia bacterium]
MVNEAVRNPREEIKDRTAAGDLQWLLERAGEIHGHYCPGLAFGVRAGYRAVRDLEAHSIGMEEIVAIVETNSCFSDGIQFVTGCTFGNNGLIYRDYGKTAVTVARRDGQGVRVSINVGSGFLEQREPEAMELFRKVVTERNGNAYDQSRLMELWRKASFNMLEVPDEELLDVKTVTADIPGYARMFGSVTCSICGESIMEPRARLIQGKPVCIPCSGQEYYELVGDGIHVERSAS